jgi:hypothetical protein
LVNRIPIAPIIVRTFSSLASNNAPVETEYAQQLSNALINLWSLAARRMTAEVQLECFGAALSASSSIRSSSELKKVFCRIASSFRTSLATSSAKKKVCEGVHHIVFFDRIQY